MNTHKQLLAAAAVSVALIACHPSKTGSASRHMVGGLDLDRAAGQLMMVGFRGPELTPAIRQTLRQLHPGGVCLYAQNITGAAQVAKLNDELRFCLDEALPPFIAIDHEGGVVVRIYDGVTVFPSSMALGATRSTELATDTGKTFGRELRLLGFNMNLAPVLDTPHNLAIGSRAFSDDPRLIAELGSAFIAGQQEAGVATVAKHFPGEGQSHGDSHDQLPVRWEAAATIRAELSPFCDAIQHDLDAVMTAHVAVPALARNRSPATVSGKLLTGVLRQELGFDGLILTDELEGMRAISGYGVDRAAVAAINAGADMVFVAFSPDVQNRVHRALMSAVQSGKIPQARFEQAIAHIVALKTKRKLFDTSAPVEERLSLLQRKTGEQVAREIAQQSITRLRADTECLPFQPNSRIGLITDSQNLAQAIRARAAHTNVVMVDREALRDAPSIKKRIRELVAGSDVVIAAFILQSRLNTIHDCLASSCPLVLLFMNVPDPDILRILPNAQLVLVNYSYQPVSAEAVVRVLFENAVTPGILPVKSNPAPAVIRTATAN